MFWILDELKLSTKATKPIIGKGLTEDSSDLSKLEREHFCLVEELWCLRSHFFQNLGHAAKHKLALTHSCAMQ